MRAMTAATADTRCQTRSRWGYRHQLYKRGTTGAPLNRGAAMLDAISLLSRVTPIVPHIGDLRFGCIWSRGRTGLARAGSKTVQELAGGAWCLDSEVRGHRSSWKSG